VRQLDPVDAGLAALARDPAVSRIAARVRRDGSGRDVVVTEVIRNGKAVADPVIQDLADLERAIGRLLGPDRALGAVSVRGLHGLAAVPPAADTPLLVLDRIAPPRAMPERDDALPPHIAASAAALLRAGAGVVLAGPRGGPRAGAVVRSVLARLGSRARLVIVEDGPQTPVPTDAVRLRAVAHDALRALRHAVVVINVAEPPSLPALSGAALVVVAARAPEAALARLTAGSAATPPALARLCADAAPLLLWFGQGQGGAGLLAAYEILPAPDRSGLPLLQMLAGVDPVGGGLVPTGAVPVDPALRDAWNAPA
jgi:hypothetical protein